MLEGMELVLLRIGETTLPAQVLQVCPQLLFTDDFALGPKEDLFGCSWQRAKNGPQLPGMDRDESVFLVLGLAPAAAAMETGKNWIIVRNSKKDYGTSKLVEGTLSPGDVVLLVEDIATTGGQVLEAAKVITDAGAKVKKIVSVIDRKQGARENITGAGYTFESILTKDDLGIVD